jgi:uncharacterized protein YbjQ (UPF0145 family)
VFAGYDLDSLPIQVRMMIEQKEAVLRSGMMAEATMYANHVGKDILADIFDIETGIYSKDTREFDDMGIQMMRISEILNQQVYGVRFSDKLVNAIELMNRDITLRLSDDNMRKQHLTTNDLVNDIMSMVRRIPGGESSLISEEDVRGYLRNLNLEITDDRVIDMTEYADPMGNGIVTAQGARVYRQRRDHVYKQKMENSELARYPRLLMNGKAVSPDRIVTALQTKAKGYAGDKNGTILQTQHAVMSTALLELMRPENRLATYLASEGLNKSNAKELIGIVGNGPNWYIDKKEKLDKLRELNFYKNLDGSKIFVEPYFSTGTRMIMPDSRISEISARCP